MADFTIADGEHGVYNQYTMPGTELVIDITRPISTLTIRKRGPASLYYTTDGTEAVVEGQNTHEMPAEVVAQDRVPIDEDGSKAKNGETIQFRLISAGAVLFSVSVE